MTQATRNCPTCNTPLPGVAAYCYVCGSATPPGFDLMTGERVAITKSDISAADLHTRVQRLLGPGYALGERIGAGGFAEVFKVQDLRLKRTIAVKVLRPDLGLTPGMLERFRREAEVIAALRHPNIVPIYDVGEGTGVAFIVMPFIEGESLRARMEREGAMPPEETRRILREAASGLAAAHEAGVIHRDVKPENIMLEGRESRVLLMDFGIAKAVGGELDTPVTDEGVAPTLTSTGIIVGTPQYMSPEQACGDKTIDPRTDQYSLAVVGYRMLSGQLPFDGDSTRAVLYKQLVAEATPLLDKAPDAPPGLAGAIAKAMSKEPRDRFADMLAFGAAIAAPEVATAGARAKARPSGPPIGERVGAVASSVRKGINVIPSPALAWPRIKALPGSGRTQSLVALALLVLGAVGLKVALSGGNSGLTDFRPSSAVDPLSTAAETSPSDAGATPPVTPEVAPSSAPAATPKNAAGRTRTGSPPPPPPTGTTAAAPAPVPEQPKGPTCSGAVASGTWTAAATACEAAAQAGDATAMRLLAGMYDRGNGVAEDPAKAVSWYERAAPSDAAAKLELARLLEIGRGTKRDTKRAIDLLREAAGMGNRQAMLTLGFRLENGAGMSRDYKEAAVWYRKVADLGDQTAMLKMADWLRRGRGVEKNEAEAVSWYRKAADAGSSEGAWQAAKALLDGRGVAKDEAAGMVLLRKAAQQGHPDAQAEFKKRGG